MKSLLFVLSVIFFTTILGCKNSKKSISQNENDATVVWRPLKADLKTNDFTIYGDSLIKFNKDGRFKPVKTDAGVVFKDNDGEITIQCRCPRSFTGSCFTVEPMDGSYIACAGSNCRHSEVPELKTSCRIFAGGKREDLAHELWWE